MFKPPATPGLVDTLTAIGAAVVRNKLGKDRAEGLRATRLDRAVQVSYASAGMWWSLSCLLRSAASLPSRSSSRRTPSRQLLGAWAGPRCVAPSACPPARAGAGGVGYSGVLGRRMWKLELTNGSPNVCVVLALVSAVLFDRTTAPRWLLGTAGCAAAVVARRDVSSVDIGRKAMRSGRSGGGHRGGHRNRQACELGPLHRLLLKTGS